MKKRGLLNKRATSYVVWFVILEIILISMISWGLTTYLISVKENTIFEKNYLSRDIALTTTAINFAPHDLKYVYSIKDKELAKFDFEWRDNSVKVSEKESKLKTGFRYMSDISMEQKGKSVTESDKIIFSKKGNELSITK